MALPKIETPKYELTIPSTSEKVTYRPYLVKEEKVLMMAMESDDNQQMARALKEVVSACVDFPVNGSDVEDLAMFDLEYIFSQLRAKSVGETTEVGMSCEECEKKNDVEIVLEDVYVKTEDGKSQNIQITDTIGVSMKYPSVDAVLKTQGAGDSKQLDQVFSLIISCIDSIYAGDEVYDARQQEHSELNEFIESLNSEQFSRIQGFIEQMPQASLDVSFKCLSCGHDNQYTVRGLANFFG